MPSILIVEDGTGLADSNAYATAALVRAYAALRGIALSNDDTVIEPLIIVATDYIESQNFIYQQASSSQALSWPRIDPWCYDPTLQFPSSTLVAATARLVIDQVNGVVLQPTTLGGQQFVVEERVDVITTRYSEKLGTLDTPVMRIVNNILKSILVNGSGLAMLRTVRV